MGVCRPVLQILTQFHTPKLTFSTPVFRPGVGRNYVIIKANSDTVRTSTWCSHKWESEIAGVYFSQTTEIYFLKIHLEFAYYKYLHAFPRKPYPNSDQNKQNLYPFSDQNGAKTISFGVPSPPRRVSYEILLLVLSKVLNHLPIRHILCRTTGILASWGWPAK